jgi:hypothetical protein
MHHGTGLVFVAHYGWLPVRAFCTEALASILATCSGHIINDALHAQKKRRRNLTSQTAEVQYAITGSLYRNHWSLKGHNFKIMTKLMFNEDVNIVMEN